MLSVKLKFFNFDQDFRVLNQIDPTGSQASTQLSNYSIMEIKSN